VLYSPRGLSSPALKAQAARFVSAVARKRRERCKVLGIGECFCGKKKGEED
jgi:dihydroorotate dehydrogenase